VALIGSLEQFDLANILRRIEVFSKTGLLVVKQGDLWVEFYFRQGQLVCIGPVRANTSLIDRLVQANLLSLQTLPQIRALVGSSEPNETRIALTLINEGYLSREVLRAWASHETSQILQTILSWPTGEVYFEDDRPTPADRLLIALSVATLLDTLPASVPHSASTSAPSTNEPAFTPSAQSLPVMPMKLAAKRSAGRLDATQLIEKVPSFAAPAPGTLNASQLLEQAPAFNSAAPTGDGDAAGLFSAAQLIEDFPFGASDAAPFAEEAPLPSFASAAPASAVFGSELNISASNQVSFLPPQPVANPLPPARIDTSFMTPELVLVPVDLSSLRERNPQVQLTPDQWRLLALIDGQSSVQMLCQALMASLDQVRSVAGELLAIGLVMPQPTGALAELPSPAPNGMTNGMGIAPSGQYAAAQPTWLPQSAGPAPFTPPIATQAQWGNGNNGAALVVGGGWMLSGKQPVVQPGYSQPGAAYAPVGGYR
jgi:hypothetical protein